MNQTPELADFIFEFLELSLGESEESLRKEAAKLDATYEQFLAMSLAQLIAERYTLTPKYETN